MPGQIRIAMVAGEASGDLLASHLIRALKKHLPEASFYGIGGPKMQAEGFQAQFPSEKLAVRGYAEALRHYREITGIRRKLLAGLLADPPAAFIGVDAPDFNLHLEKRLKAHGIAAIHYVSPSIWAWRGGRIRGIAQSVSHMLALFPFEEEIYRRHRIPVSYVGHPLADVIPLEVNRAALREKLGLPQDQLVFALLPGSRQSELHYMAGTFIETARRLHQRFPQARFLVPLATRETRDLFELALYRLSAQELPITRLFGHAQDAMAAADGVLDHHWPDCVDHDTEAEFDAARAALPEPGGTQPGQRIVITGEDGQQVAGMFYADRPALTFNLAFIELDYIHRFIATKKFIQN